ncbi:MAG TPA: hypothetical protein VEF34_05220 [Syntrophobacteraceae bacterium]|nr:hypothetical protein [Syntrophobacteraceae bacterium]
MAYRIASADYPARVVFGFTAGFLAVLIFHQLTLWLLWGIGWAPFAPYSTAVTKPFGVPAVISLALWGGVWGVLFALVEPGFPAHGGYWAAAFLFGAVLPSLVALFVVLPLKGRPVGGGWHPALLMTAFMINGAWGVGVGLFFRILSGWFRRRRHRPS